MEGEKRAAGRGGATALTSESSRSLSSVLRRAVNGARCQGLRAAAGATYQQQIDVHLC